MNVDSSDKVTHLKKEYRELKTIIDDCCKSAEKLNVITKSIAGHTRKEFSRGRGGQRHSANSIESLTSALIKNLSSTFTKQASAHMGYNSRGSSGLNSRYMNDVVGGFFGALSGAIFGSAKIGGMRASGGSVAAGVPYVVGERGAEVFVPQSSGYIMPNQQAGSRPINLVMNVTTPDVDSFRKSQTQVLAYAARALQKASRY